ncbi:4623_t:CDS:2 [Funneliformis geosporum]|uniref:16276_t:CDS:1 n=1 Tax=Funneliformis geosporum TaxID=1117311 RepID=A0A9W4SS33_9GLOM|nr:4623_t:CDS:2 [Funneliformis geosporum]CAI2179369.1 16276_t:CDS:2 [Funneliformis geosporum]
MSSKDKSDYGKKIQANRRLAGKLFERTIKSTKEKQHIPKKTRISIIDEKDNNTIEVDIVTHELEIEERKITLEERKMQLKQNEIDVKLKELQLKKMEQELNKKNGNILLCANGKLA